MRFVSVSYIIIILFLSNIRLFASESKDSNVLEKEKKVIRDIIISTDIGAFIPIQSVIFYNINATIQLDNSSGMMLGVLTPAVSSVSGYGILLEYRWYWQEQSLEKWFLSPRINYTNIKSAKDVSETYSLGLLANYQFIANSGFALNLGFGLAYNTGPSLQNSELKTSNGKRLSNTTPIFRIELGWAF